MEHRAKVRVLAAVVAVVLVAGFGWSRSHAKGTEKEPNETVEQATPVKAQGTVLGYITDRADVDAFKLVTGSSYKNVIDIEVKDKKWGFSVGLKVTTKEGQVVSETQNFARGDRKYTLSARPNSTYYIWVYCKAECGNGDYALTLTKGK